MKTLLKYLKLIGIFILFLIGMSGILSIFNIFGLNYKIISVLSIIMMVLLFFVYGFIEGLNGNKKGFISGGIIGIILCLTLILLNLVFFRNTFSLSRLLYYVILLLTSVLGGMIGINKKKD